MPDHCDDRCSFERAAEVEFRGLAEDIHEIRDRVMRLEQTLARGVLLLLANLAGLAATMAQGMLRH
jgi:hypothetical protein